MLGACAPDSGADLLAAVATGGLFLQCPAFLTRRLTDNHVMRFARQRWRCSLSQPTERASPTAHRLTKTHALTNLERYFATHLLYYLSYQRAKACTRWRETNNRARGVDVGTRLWNERAERLQRAEN